MERNKGKSRGKVIAIVVMLVLCVAAAMFIVSTVRQRAESRRAAEAAAEEAAQTQEVSETPDEKADESMSHVYANSGASSEEKYTAEAFDGAVAAGCSCLAMPIVVSADGTAYIADNDDLSDLTGVNGYLSGMVDSQVSGIKTKGGNSLLRLSDVFDKYGRDVSYVIEIKYTDDSNISAFTDTVKQYELEDIVSVSSSYYAALEKTSQEFPDMPKIFLCGNEEDYAAALGVSYLDTISVEKSLMTEERLAQVHENSRKFGVWTLNSEEDIKKALEMGVDSYYTDEGALAASLEKEQ